MTRALTDAQRRAARASRERAMVRARERGRVGLYRLHTAFIMPIAWLLTVLPVDAASNFGGWLARLIIPRFSDIAYIRRTMRVPFPAISDTQAGHLIAEMSENVGRVLGESLHLEAFAGAGNPRLSLSGVEHVDAARREGRGILFISGHFANWELFEVGLASLGLRGAKVLHHPSNPFVIETIAHRRYMHGLDQQIATGEGVFVRVRDTLRSGEVVQMLADQRTRKGAKVPFFGLETTTNLVPARAARETGAAVILMSMQRLGPARLSVIFHPARHFGPADDEVEIMTWANRFFEDELKRSPGQWLWGHPRWSDAFENKPAQPLVTPPPGS